MQDKSQADEIRVTDRRRVNIDDRETAAAEDEDETPEEAAAAPPTSRASHAAPPSHVAELEKRAKGAEQKLVEVQSRFEQLRAQMQREMDETRQRLNRSADERAARNKAEMLTTLLPVLDNLHRALDAARQGSSIDALLNGLQGTVSGFENALAANGTEVVSAVGAQFDPEQHEAVDTVQVEPARDGLVTQEYSRGYRLGDRLLRPARVQVGRAAGSASSAVE